jgi:hypothetical protein
LGKGGREVKGQLGQYNSVKLERGREVKLGQPEQFNQVRLGRGGRAVKLGQFLQNK